MPNALLICLSFASTLPLGCPGLASLESQEGVYSFFFQAGELAKFIDGNILPFLFTVFFADAGEQGPGGPFAQAGDVHHVFSINDYAVGD